MRFRQFKEFKPFTPMKVTVRGVKYPSQIAAAKALGVTARCISKRVCNGIPLRRPFNKNQGKATPVTVKGVKYPSHSAAGRALGMSEQLIALRLKRGIPLHQPVKYQRPYTRIKHVK